MYLVDVIYTEEGADRAAELRSEHYRYFGPFFDRGTFLFGARRVPPTGGVILVEGTTREELEDILAGDPYAKAGVATYTIGELLPTKVTGSLSHVITVQPA